MSVQVLQEMCLKSQNPVWKEGVDRAESWTGTQTQLQSFNI